MPELPEVETQVRDLQKVVGKKILELSSDTKKAFSPSFVKVKKEIEGKKITAVRRRAKYIAFELSGNLILVIHFRMTGHFLLARSSKPLEKMVRHQFKLSGGTYLQLSDIRKFGTIELCDEKSYEKISKKLGPEPLSKEFTLPKLREMIKTKKGMLKALLLNQNFIAGIGNIYADEICFEARLHPASRVQKLKKADVEKLFHAIKNQLHKGIKNRGTTIGEYVDTSGRRGKNQLSLLAYRQHGKACKVCGKIMKKMKVQQRTTTFCLQCQKKC